MNSLVDQGDEVRIPLDKKLPFWSDEFWECMASNLDSSGLHGSKNSILLFLGDEIIKLFPKHFHTSYADDSAATTETGKPIQIMFDAAGFCADLTLAALKFDLSKVDVQT